MKSIRIEGTPLAKKLVVVQRRCWRVLRFFGIQMISCDGGDEWASVLITFGWRFITIPEWEGNDPEDD